MATPIKRTATVRESPTHYQIWGEPTGLLVAEVPKHVENARMWACAIADRFVQRQPLYEAVYVAEAEEG